MPCIRQSVETASTEKRRAMIGTSHAVTESLRENSLLQHGRMLLRHVRCYYAPVHRMVMLLYWSVCVEWRVARGFCDVIGASLLLRKL
jgi:hypothetical protein